MSQLVKLKAHLWVNPAHIVYVEQKSPYQNGPDALKQRVEVCVTMYGR